MNYGCSLSIFFVKFKKFGAAKVCGNLSKWRRNQGAVGNRKFQKITVAKVFVALKKVFYQSCWAQ